MSHAFFFASRLCLGIKKVSVSPVHVHISRPGGPSLLAVVPKYLKAILLCRITQGGPKFCFCRDLRCLSVVHRVYRAVTRVSFPHTEHTRCMFNPGEKCGDVCGYVPGNGGDRDRAVHRSGTPMCASLQSSPSCFFYLSEEIKTQKIF